MKKVYCIFICFLIAITFTSCDFIDNISSNISVEPSENTAIDDNRLSQFDDSTKNYNSVIPDIEIIDGNYQTVSSTECYSLLRNYYQRSLYNQMKKNIYYISDEVTDDGYYYIKRIVISDVELSVQDIRMTFYAFIYDNVDVFWLSRSFGYDYQDGNTIVELYSLMDSNECKNNINILRNYINDYISSIPQNLDEFEREIFIHDLIVNNCEYDYSTVSFNDNWKSFTVIGVFNNNLSVCEGYAKAFKLLLNLNGIHSRLILGYGDNEPHMWNLVNINNDWYHTDITWNDSSLVSQYNYFNLSTEKILYNHSIDLEFPEDLNSQKENKSFNFKLPECNSMKYNYHYQKTYVLTEFSSESDNEIIQNICNAVLDNKDYFSVIIGDELVYEDTVNSLITEEPYKIFYYLMSADDILLTKYGITLEHSSIEYYTIENLRLITIELKYNKEDL